MKIKTTLELLPGLVEMLPSKLESLSLIVMFKDVNNLDPVIKSVSKLTNLSYLSLFCHFYHYQDFQISPTSILDLPSLTSFTLKYIRSEKLDLPKFLKIFPFPNNICKFILRNDRTTEKDVENIRSIVLKSGIQSFEYKMLEQRHYYFY